MPSTTQATTLQESVNIILSVLGEAPVNSLTGTTSSLALNIIEEVSTDIQSKGWWFNQQTSSAYDSTANIIIYPSNSSSNWHSSIPEEARRYITIRSARIAHSRIIGTEENFKFTYQEELVSLAILQQAHVRNAGSELTFSSYPSELKGLGIDEFIFLTGNVEDKLGSLKLATEIKTQARIEEETDLLEAQATTEGSKQSNLAADTTLKGAQATTEASQQSVLAAQATNIGADTTLKGSQSSNVQADTTLKGAQATTEASQQTLLAAQATNVGADTTLKGSQSSNVQADTTLKGSQSTLVTAQATTEGSQQTLLGAQATTESSKQSNLAADTTLKGAQATTEASQQSVLAAQATNVGADTTLKGSQSSNVQADTTLKGAQTAKLQVEKDVIEVQKLKTLEETVLTSQQVAKTDAETELLKDTEAKTVAEKDVLVSQKNKLDDERTLSEAEKDYFLFSGVIVNGVARTYKDYRAELRIMGYQETQFNGLPAYKKKEAITDAANLRSSTVPYATAGQLFDSVNNVLELIGELPVADCGDNLLATKAKKLLEKTDTELQARGWWFNTEIDVEVNPISSLIAWLPSWLNIEINGVPTTKQKAGANNYVRNLETKKYNDWSGTQKATIIYKRELDETPQKYIELLEVRVARLLTELYPQSGIDIQRLPKMEAELNAYFKDRENDQGNYSVFDNYDAAVRVGINRSYNLF